MLQRALGIGYGRAARLIDFMAEDGIVGEFKKRLSPARFCTRGKNGRRSRAEPCCHPRRRPDGRWFSRLASGKYVDHGERSFDDVRRFGYSQSHEIAFREHFSRFIALASRFREDFDCTVVKVDDPEERDTSLGVPRELDSTIVAIGRLGDLDEKDNLLWPRGSMV